MNCGDPSSNFNVLNIKIAAGSLSIFEFNNIVFISYNNGYKMSNLNLTYERDAEPMESGLWHQNAWVLY